MSTVRPAEYLAGLVRKLCHQVGEAEWVEFKRSKVDQQEIGECISALSNAAALNGKAHGYMPWGIDNETHDIVGVDFDPFAARKGNEALENWLLRLLIEAVDDGKIVISSSSAGRRRRTYLPFWVAPNAEEVLLSV